jgi:hypothetical protein
VRGSRLVSGQAAVATAECLPGEHALGGGAFSSRNDGFLSTSYPVAGQPESWSVILRSPAANASLTAYVICAGA